MSSSAVLYVSTVLIWGTTWYAITFQAGDVPSELSVAYRFALASVLLFGWCRLRGARLRFGTGDHLRMALLGLLLFGVNYLLFYLAAGRLTSGLLAVIYSAVVPLNILNGALLLSRPVSREVVAGAALGLPGLALVFAPELGAVFGGGWAGDGIVGAIALAFAATYLASLGQMVAASSQARGLPVLQSNAWGMAYGAAFMAAWALLAGRPVSFATGTGYMVSLVYLAVFGSVIAFGCFLTLVGRIGPERAAYATVLFPVVALAISTVLEDYHWTPLSLAGVGMVLAGNLLAVSRAARRALGAAWARRTGLRAGGSIRAPATLD